jgi:hypothetical protein
MDLMFVAPTVVLPEATLLGNRSGSLILDSGPAWKRFERKHKQERDLWENKKNRFAV